MTRGGAFLLGATAIIAAVYLSDRSAEGADNRHLPGIAIGLGILGAGLWLGVKLSHDDASRRAARRLRGATPEQRDEVERRLERYEREPYANSLSKERIRDIFIRTVDDVLSGR